MEYLAMYRASGALLEGHFELSSGLHSDRYLQSALVLQDPEKGATLGRALAEKLPAGIEYVVGPAMGGLIPAYELGRALGVYAQFTERKDDVMQLRRGFSLPEGAKVMVVDDILTTGGSIRECVEAIRGLGVDLVGAGCLVDRSNGEANDLPDMPLYALVEIPVRTWQPEDCPLCREGIPVTKPGSRAA